MKILIVSPEPPSPLLPRAFRFALLLAGKHEVTFAYISELPGRYVAPTVVKSSRQMFHSHGIDLYKIKTNWLQAARWTVPAVASGIPCRVALFTGKYQKRQVQHLVQTIQPDVVHIDRIYAYFLASFVDIPMIVDLVDPLGWRIRTIHRETHTFRGFWERYNGLNVQRLENQIIRQKTPCVLASEFGVSKLMKNAAHGYLEVVPNPLPRLSGFSESGRFPGKGPHLCFVGNLRYAPNELGLLNFYHNVWLSLREKFPSVSLHIIGSRPGRSLKCLVSQEQGIHLYPNVADPGEIACKCDIVISPVQVCSGFSNKIVDAVYSYRLPVISSSAAIAGLPGEIGSVVLCADSCKEWIDRVGELFLKKDFGKDYVDRLHVTMVNHLDDNRILSLLEQSYRFAISQGKVSCFQAFSGTPIRRKKSFQRSSIKSHA